MRLFEKIFNHQFVSRLEDSGMFMVTSMERAWLKTMLAPRGGRCVHGGYVIEAANDARGR
ncbi:hypothetical protein [Paenibacillus antri]|uniref:hypothetical protein n=1 Tax=Paenibacillus antri TaxID=2582848 RepID=UPI00192E3FA0